MGGPSTSTANQITQEQLGLSQQQLGIEQQALNTSNQEQQQYQQLTAPAVAYNTALASGDPKAIMTALAPQLGAYSQERAANQESIYESMPAGAARDMALTQSNLEVNSQIAGLQSSAVAQAPSTLANLGAGFGSNALQELGASLGFGNSAISATNAASTTNANVMNVEEQSKAATLGFLGQLAGAAGTAASGGVFGSLGGGGKTTYV
jgi:hypothetical protein